MVCSMSYTMLITDRKTPDANVNQCSPADESWSIKQMPRQMHGEDETQEKRSVEADVPLETNREIEIECARVSEVESKPTSHARYAARMAKNYRLPPGSWDSHVHVVDEVHAILLQISYKPSR